MRNEQHNSSNGASRVLIRRYASSAKKAVKCVVTPELAKHWEVGVRDYCQEMRLAEDRKRTLHLQHPLWVGLHDAEERSTCQAAVDLHLSTTKTRKKTDL